MRTHLEGSRVNGTRRQPVLLGAVVLLGTSALVVLGFAEEHGSAVPTPAEVRGGPAILPNTTLAAEAPPTMPTGPKVAAAPVPKNDGPGLTPAPRAPTKVGVVAAVGGDSMVELGRRLFFDPAASHSKRVACASCHKPEHGFSDPELRSADDFGPTPRHSQTVLNVSVGAPMHWDGEFATMEELITARTGDERAADGGYVTVGSRVAKRKVTPVAESLAKEGLYENAFTEAFGRGNPTKEQISEAIASYVRTLRSTVSPFDRYLEGDTAALTPEAERGHKLFAGRAGCSTCHSLDGRQPTLTDGQFHNTGISLRRTNSCRPEDMKSDRQFADGRKRITGQDRDARAIKTPSLRDVAVRAPYMHDGSFATLASVVRYYATECRAVGDRDLDSRLQPFDAGKSPTEIEGDVADLVAFLHALTGERRAGLAETAWDARTRVMRLKLVDARGAALRHVVAVQPGGDVLPGGSSDWATPRYLTPDIDGWIELTPFASTHVRVTLPSTDLRPVSGEFVPDTCDEGVLTLASVPAEVVDARGKRRNR